MSEKINRVVVASIRVVDGCKSRVTLTGDQSSGIETRSEVENTKSQKLAKGTWNKWLRVGPYQNRQKGMN